jgi:hypothetical protein
MLAVFPMRPFATKKPTRPMGLRQLGHGISNKLQIAAVTTAAITTARTNLMTKTLGPELTKALATTRKAIVPVTARLQRRIRYWRIVTTGNPTCIVRFNPQGEAAIGGDQRVIRSAGGRLRLGHNWMQPPMPRATVQSTWRLKVTGDPSAPDHDPEGCPNEIYEGRMREALDHFKIGLGFKAILACVDTQKGRKRDAQ